jgi:hypothetical protein
LMTAESVRCVKRGRVLLGASSRAAADVLPIRRRVTAAVR